MFQNATTIYEITVKYRKGIINKEEEKIILEELKDFKNRFAIEIYTVGFDRNNMHILCQFLPKYSGEQVIRLIKSLTAKQILQLTNIKKELWKGEFWTDGYYIATISSRGSKQTIENYVKNQGRNPNQLTIFNL